jgi:hypothetical protein
MSLETDIQQIKNETARGANTAVRVGTALEGLHESAKYANAGYSHTGAFVGKSADNLYVWESQPGSGIRYSQSDVSNDLWKVFGLNREIHNSVDRPYWKTPDPSLQGIGLFEGEHLPEGVSSLVDYDYSYNTENLTLQNIITRSEDFASFSAVNNVSKLANQVGAQGNLTAIQAHFTDPGAVQVKLPVNPNKTYTLSFKAKLGSGNYLVPQYSVIDQTNDEVITPPTAYRDNLNSSTFSPVSAIFTTPANCYEIMFKVAQANNFASDFPSSVFLDEVQINEGDTVLNYVPTSGTAATTNKITHGYYAYNGNATGYEGSTGRIKLNDIKIGDQLRVRFDFNVVPQVTNTTIEPALWYSNRNANDEITFSFPLTSQPIFYGSGTVGETFLNRVEISAWITSEEDINALALPAIKSDNPVIIQPLGLLITILR